MFAFLLGPIGRLIGVAGISAIAAAFITVWATSRSYELTIAHMQNEELKEQKQNAEASLLQFQNTVALINTSALAYNKTTAVLNSKFNGLVKDLHNAQVSIPLPVDCKPDAGRLRELQEAVQAANHTVVGQ